MIRSQFENYRGLYTGGNQLVTELLRVAAVLEAGGPNAAALVELLSQDFDKVLALVPADPVDPGGAE